MCARSKKQILLVKMLKKQQNLTHPKAAKLATLGVVTGASLRCDMGWRASDLLFHVCITTLHGGAIRWANEFKNIS